MSSISRATVFLCRACLCGIVVLSMIPATAGAEPAPRDAAARFYQKIDSSQWLAYNPTAFRLDLTEPIPEAEIRADLQALLDAGLNPKNIGLSTYSTSPADGLDSVPRIARELRFGGFIAGVWNPRDDAEIEVVVRLVNERCVDAVCIGNEGLNSRYDWDELRQAISFVRQRGSAVPVSTSERIGSYGNKKLTDPQWMDWLYPNMHPVFENHCEPAAAANWLQHMADTLEKRSNLKLLIHETGWPSRGLPWHTPENQELFWRTIFTKSACPTTCFECYDQVWKSEIYRGAEIGTAWGLFSSDRKPKPAAAELIKRSKDSEPQTESPD